MCKLICVIKRREKLNENDTKTKTNTNRSDRTRGPRRHEALSRIG